MAKRKVSAKTRVKLSQAAKKRRRAPKGSSHAGQFAEGVRASGAGRLLFAADMPGGPGGIRPPRAPGETKIPSREFSSIREKVHTLYGEAYQRAEEAHTRSSGARAKTAADVDFIHRQAMQDVQRQMLSSGADPSWYEPANELNRATISRIDLEQARAAARKLMPVTPQEKWKKTTSTTEGRISTAKYLKSLPPHVQARVEQDLGDPKSEFNKGLQMSESSARKNIRSHGAGRRLDIWATRMQQGASYEDAVKGLSEENRGRGGLKRGQITFADPNAKETKKPKVSPQDAQNLEVIKDRNRAKGRKDKYEKVGPTAREFSFGVRAPRPSKTSELEAAYPKATEKQLVEIRQGERETIANQFLQNQRFAHEQRRANFLQSDSREGPDRVVFFATNLGGFAPSVPTNSLIGQYIIRRRKKMLLQNKVATKKDLRGRFPYAVRDMHIMEASTGVAAGVEGRAGLFQKSGWRRGGKTSRGFGKPVPVGTSILRDSTGAPIYDAEGNIRYTEGYTRPFQIGTDKEIGLRVFLG